MEGRFLATAVAVAALSFASSTALAVPATSTITFDPITASWINVNPATVSVSGNGTQSPSLRWGTPATWFGGQSGYDFVAASPPVTITIPPSPSADFSLGEFTHINNPIVGTSLTSATLQIDTGITVDSTSIGSRSFLFDFTHNETPNAANPCANGEPNGGTGVNQNGCADIITVSVSTLTDSFEVGGVDYTLNILGFQATSGPNNGSFVAGFETVERATNTAVILSNADATANVVPEPATLALLGGGVAGIGWIGRRRRKAA